MMNEIESSVQHWARRLIAPKVVRAHRQCDRNEERLYGCIVKRLSQRRTTILSSGLRLLLAFVV
jgi:hypothetical protein